MTRRKSTCDLCNHHCGPQYKFDTAPLQYIVVGAGCLKKLVLSAWSQRSKPQADFHALLVEAQEYLPPAMGVDGQYKQAYRNLLARIEEALDKWNTISA